MGHVAARRMPAATAMCGADEAHDARLDASLCAYLRLYEEYVRSLVELQTLLRDGHLNLARARRDISHSRNTSSPCVGVLQFPQEIRALVRVGGTASDTSDALRLIDVLPGETASADADASADDDASDDGSDDGPPVGVISGDRLTLERGAVAGADHGVTTLRSDISMAPGARIGDVAHAQFESLIAEGAKPAEGAKLDGTATAPSLPRPKPQTRPDPFADPLKWFAVLPPHPLRKAQARFRRACDLIVAMCDLRARLAAAAEAHEALSDSVAGRDALGDR